MNVACICEYVQVFVSVYVCVHICKMDSMYIYVQYVYALYTTL